MSAQASCTILIIDDDDHIVQYLSRLLEGEANLLTAGHGRKGVKLARAEQPDLILLDIMMPGMGGHEVCQKLKANPATASIPIVFLSARSSEQEIIEGLGLGAIDYITKPFQPQIVLNKIKSKLRMITDLKKYGEEKTIEYNVPLSRPSVVEKGLNIKDDILSNRQFSYILGGILLFVSMGLFFYLGATSGDDNPYAAHVAQYPTQVARGTPMEQSRPVYARGPDRTEPVNYQTTAPQGVPQQDSITIETAVSCDVNDMIFKIANKGDRWPSLAAVRIYDMATQAVLVERNIKLARNQTMNFKLPVENARRNGAGLWIKPSWEDRPFVYDAKGRCNRG